jgi:release factor glutamine methyltransferase
LTTGFALDASTARAEALAWLAETFERSFIEDPKREAALTLSAAAGVAPIALIVDPEATLGAAARRVEEFAARRTAGEPLSRIVGMREFWGLKLAISPDVLDPRPETETVVEAALRLCANRREDPLHILDLGVGSGALLCSLLGEFGRARGVGVDVSQGAAEVARRNVEASGLAERAEIRVGDWTKDLVGPFDLIVSNPPYVASADLDRLPSEVRNFDPPLALDGGADGLDAYRAILPASLGLLAPGGRLIVEVGAAQSGDILGLAARLGYVNSETRRDLAGIERAVIARRPA